MGPLRNAERALADAAHGLAIAADSVLDMNNSREDRENSHWLRAMVALADYNQRLKQVEAIKAELPWSK